MKTTKQDGYQWIGAHSNRNVIQMVLTHLLFFTIGFIVRGSGKVSQVPADIVTNKCRKYGDGWSAIEVFYGKSDKLEMMPPQLEWYGQVKQDLIVSRLFRNKVDGFFLDLAANDATSLSNTFSLERKFNWSGVCIEPNPLYWSRLSYRNCQVVAAVIGEKRMDEVLFKLSAAELGGIVGDKFDNGDATGASVLYTTTLIEILQRFNVPTNIDYLSLDVEGAEYFVMQYFPFNTYQISVMTVERPDDSLKKLLNDNGYELIGTIDGHGETLWARKAIKDSLDFASVQQFLIR